MEPCNPHKFDILAIRSPNLFLFVLPALAGFVLPFPFLVLARVLGLRLPAAVQLGYIL